MQKGNLKTNKYREWLAVLLLAIALLIVIWAFSDFPIEQSNFAIDWKQIWEATHNFQAQYGSTELRTPPWALPFIWPLTLFNLSTSWALASFATISVLVISVPRSAEKRKWIASIGLLLLSYPALRQIIDGNIEAMIIAGVLLALIALRREHALLFALGLLLLGAKIQESWLLIPFLIWQQWRDWPKEKRVQSYLWVLAIASPLLLWKGQEWLDALIHFPFPGTAIDSSLQATIARLGWPEFVFWASWALLVLSISIVLLRRKIKADRLGSALLISSALLLGPYAASNSVLTPFAIGVIPLFQKRPIWGLALSTLYFFPYFKLGDLAWRMNWESSYWTLVLLITLATLLFSVYKDSPKFFEEKY